MLIASKFTNESREVLNEVSVNEPIVVFYSEEAAEPVLLTPRKRGLRKQRGRYVDYSKASDRLNHKMLLKE